MHANDYWQMFLDTGAPEYYLLYSKMQKLESVDVFNRTGPGSEGHSL